MLWAYSFIKAIFGVTSARMSDVPFGLRFDAQWAARVRKSLQGHSVAIVRTMPRACRRD